MAAGFPRGGNASKNEEMLHTSSRLEDGYGSTNNYPQWGTLQTVPGASPHFTERVRQHRELTLRQLQLAR